MIKLSIRLVLLILLLVSALPTFAQGGADATVRPDAMNIRSGPSSAYPAVAQVTRGTALTLLAQDDVPMNGIWVYVRTPAGAEGWVSSDYLDINPNFNLDTLPVQAAPDAPSAPATTGETTTDTTQPSTASFPEGTGIPSQTTSRVNLRQGPGTSYRVLATLADNTAVLAQGRDATIEWVYVSTGGQQGWIYYTYIALSNGDVSALPITDAQGVVVAAASTSSSAPVSNPAPVHSAGISGFGYGGHVESFSYPNLMAGAGMTWAKRQLRFRPGMSGGEAAGAIDQAHANGFKILLGIVGYPQDMGAPGYYEDYARFVGEVAALGPDAIEVWNEMNIDREWPNGQIDPSRYTQLLAQSYNAIKGANSSVVVISGALAPTGAEGAFGTAAVWNDDRYLRGMAAAGAAQYMDCIGAHYNEGIVSPYQTSGDPRGEYYTRYLRSMINTYSGAFGGARPVCFTELGYVSPEGYGPLPGSFAWGSDTSVAEQAQWLADAVSIARSSGRVRMVIIWNIDFSYYGDDPMAGYAIVRPGGVCPACDALAGR